MSRVDAEDTRDKVRGLKAREKSTGKMEPEGGSLQQRPWLEVGGKPRWKKIAPKPSTVHEPGPENKDVF